jgi:hypothetical protein
MRLTQRLTLLFVATLAAGCVPTKDCDWAEPIRPAGGDVQTISPGLARDILAHNQKGAAICGWRP